MNDKGQLSATDDEQVQRLIPVEHE